MALHPPLPETPDAQFEWFHALAELLNKHGPVAVSAGTRSDLLRFTTEHLPGHTFPDKQDTNALIESVKRLRESERNWNKSLQAAIISACDRAEAGEPQGAADDLERFACSCPWALFARVARGQASQFVAS
jgi:hypothetical protein